MDSELANLGIMASIDARGNFGSDSNIKTTICEFCGRKIKHELVIYNPSNTFIFIAVYGVEFMLQALVGEIQTLVPR